MRATFLLKDAEEAEASETRALFLFMALGYHQLAQRAQLSETPGRNRSN
jgi:hypothetical protein